MVLEKISTLVNIQAHFLFCNIHHFMAYALDLLGMLIELVLQVTLSPACWLIEIPNLFMKKMLNYIICKTLKYFEFLLLKKMMQAITSAYFVILLRLYTMCVKCCLLLRLYTFISLIIYSAFLVDQILGLVPVLS